MFRRTGLVVVVALAALTMYPAPAQVGVVKEPQPAVPAASVQQPPPPSVTLQHQLIQVEPVRRPKPTPRLRRSLPPTQLASGPRHDTLVARARRAVVGDGRFRPEPFPRLER